MAAVNDFQLEVVEEFLQLCKKFSNGYFDECYQDLLNKIQLLEIKDHLSKRQLQLFSLDYTPHKTSDPLITYGQAPLDKTSSTLQAHQSLASVFGKVVYNSTDKKIYFYNKDADINISTPIAEIDATDFIKDGMVDNAYIKNNTLIITFNADARKQAIRVPLSSIFNPNNYYTRTQIANLLDGYYTKERIMGLLDDKAGINGSADQDFSTLALFFCMEGLPMVLSKATVDHGTEDVTLDFTDIYNNGAKLSYTFGTGDIGTKHIATEEFVADYVNEHGGSSGGYNVSFDDGNVIFSGSTQPTFNNGNIIF